MEKTFVMVKPDGVLRGLIGDIISILEHAGLKLVAIKMLRPSREIVQKHYPDTEEWYATVGHKTFQGYALLGKDAKSELGIEDPVEIGKMVKDWLVDFLTSGNVVAMVWEGNAAVLNVRRLCGNTLPIKADPGSIRGRFSLDSPDIANAQKRSVYNLVHASGEVEEANSEIRLWFPELEVEE